MCVQTHLHTNFKKLNNKKPPEIMENVMNKIVLKVYQPKFETIQNRDG